MASSLNEIKQRQELLKIQEQQAIAHGLSSADPKAILEARRHVQGIENQNLPIQSFMFSPEDFYYNSQGYKIRPLAPSYDVLRQMARTPIIRAIVGTRVEQVMNFSTFSNDLQVAGWTIRKKPKRFDTEKKESTKAELAKCNEIAEFLHHCGSFQDRFTGDDFETFLRKITQDSLILDQCAFELVRDNRGQLTKFFAVDGGTIRLAESIDGRTNPLQSPSYHGYLPAYLQVYEDRVLAEFYPWEMCLGMRNTTTDINANGYATSELEDLIALVTWILNGFQFNGNFFRSGSSPKGFLSIKGALDPAKVLEFKENWRTTLSGVQGAHKIPVLEGGADVNWINLEQSRRDMEYNEWIKFLLLTCCSVWRIDPSECGFQLSDAPQIFGQDGQKARLRHSLTKGLTPILRFLAKKINRYIVESLDPGYEFSWTGVEIEDQETALEMDVKKSSAGFVSLEDMFEKYSGRKFNAEKDTILNPTYQQAKSSQMFGGGVEDATDTDDLGVNDGLGDDDYAGDNPFEKGLQNYLNNHLLK